ncbi:MAG: aromatic ring-hydroxylating dioxygenase subunit alpha [Gemmataceae bacterium]
MLGPLPAKLSGFDATLPLEQARTIPACWYTDSDIYELECREVFGGTWQALGRADQVGKPGQFFTAELAGEPILVIRDEQGTLRALANVCRHRAARVETAGQGCASKLRCPYHGWTYDLAGKLRGTPEFEGVVDFCKEENGLPAFAVQEWGGLVWVHVNDGPSGLPDFLAPLPEVVRDLGMEKLRFVERREYRIACNWKVFVDNYLDGGYHINYVHPELAGVLDYSHYRTDNTGNVSVQQSPMTGDGKTAELRSGPVAHYIWVFPNLMLNIYQGIMDTNLVLPEGPDACRVIFDFYFAAATPPDFIAESIALSDRIQVEDLSICADVQKGMASRTYDTGRYCVRREGAIHHFHNLLAAKLTAPYQT